MFAVLTTILPITAFGASTYTGQYKLDGQIYKINKFPNYRGEQAFEDKTPPYKEHKGYEVQCISEGSIALSFSSNGKIDALNFCNPKNTQLVLDLAKKIPAPNFAKKYKLLKMETKDNPYVSYVVWVDEKAKKIYVSEYVYFTKSAIKMGVHQDDYPYSYMNMSGLAQTTGKIYSDVNSNKFCFKGKGIASIRYWRETHYSLDNPNRAEKCGYVEIDEDGYLYTQDQDE